MGKPVELIEEEVTEEPGVRLLPKAVEKVKSLLTERKRTDDYLRVFVAGGGCSGMQYGMAVEPTPGEMDNIFEIEGVRVLIDPISMMYLQGITIDYVDNLIGGGFKIDNPNAVASCGCGHSFRAGGTPRETADDCGHGS